MPRITYISHAGETNTVEVPVGMSVMRGAVSNGIPGIDADCGGSCACATCHCYVDDLLAAALPAPSAGELDMLENVAAERRPNSRLACQIKAGPALEGGVVHLPECQE